MTKATGQDYASGGPQNYANGEDELPSAGKGKQMAAAAKGKAVANQSANGNSTSANSTSAATVNSSSVDNSSRVNNNSA